jgi:hypothetical protein
MSKELNEAREERWEKAEANDMSDVLDFVVSRL